MNRIARIVSLRCWARLALLFVAVLIAGPVSITAATASDFLSATLPKTGAEPNDLPYRLLVPAGYNSANEYPLIVFLHGSGERGNNNSAQLGNNANGALQLVSTANQAAFPCFMLAPQASVSEGWNANTLGQVIRAIQQLSTTYSINPNRIYVTGLSMGGAGSWEIIVRYPTFFAAAVPMSGWGAGSYEKIVGLPIWNFHAVNDGTVGVNGSDNAVAATRQAGGRVIYTRYATGGHGIWPTAYANPNLLPWMMAQERNRPMGGTPIISISSPSGHIALPPATSSKNVVGTASIPGGVTQVNWTFTPWTGGAGVDTSTYALASGTDNWSVANAAVAGNSTLFLAIATGPSGATGTGSATGGGVMTLNDYFWNVPTGANVTPPTIAITTPTGTGTLTTAEVFLNLAGTAAPAGSKTVQGISWRNDRGGEGFGIGTTAWRIDGIDLQPGDNLITVTVRDSASITASATFMVHATTGVVPVAPSFSTQPLSQTVTAGSAVTFTAAASGSPTPTFQWKKGGVVISGATNAAYSIASVATGDAGSYTVVATNSVSSVTSNTAVLTINTSPAFTTQPTGATVTTGTSFTFTAAVNGSPAPTLQWRKNGTVISGATGSSYTIALSAMSDAGSYVVVATNVAGAATSNAATLSVLPAEFDFTGYYGRNPVVAAAYGADHAAAWLHYRNTGIYNGEVFDDDFRVEEYLALYPELFAIFGSDLGSALEHWLTTGKFEGRLGRVPTGFSAAGYFARNPDVAVAVNNDPVLAWGHYWLYGIYEGRAYDDELRVFEYLAINADLTAAFVNDWRTAALHWMRYGRTEGRLGRLPLIFNSTEYLVRNPDVAATWGTNPTTDFLHFWLYGINEGRTFDNFFRVDEYLALNPDLLAVFGTDRRGAFKHWVRYGQAEGRLGRNP